MENRYYITENQIELLADAVKKLPISAKTFEEADQWVGLYIHIVNLRGQKIATNENEVGNNG